jgi:inositol-hexakisphosphate/diphosphoinositol-pentakisphosphate 1-kinase
MSEGAHSSNVLDSALDARHSLNVQSRKLVSHNIPYLASLAYARRRKLTQHLPYSLVIEKLSKHFHRLGIHDDLATPQPPFTNLTLTGDPVKQEEAGKVSVLL